jgi:hypothetical protein
MDKLRLNPWLNRRDVGVAYADYWLRPKGTDQGGAGLQPTPKHARDTRRSVESYV